MERTLRELCLSATHVVIGDFTRDMRDFVEGQDTRIGLGLGLASVVSVTMVAVGLVWGRRGAGRAHRGKPSKTETEKGVKTEFEEINRTLEENMRDHIAERMKVVKMEMKLKRLEMERKVEEVRRKENEELTKLEEKYKKDREEVEARHQADIARVTQECELEEESLLASLRETRLVLAGSGDRLEAEVIEQGRGELECPVCMEEMRPPRRIWQCSDGHPVCERCRRKPEVNCCPTCRKYLVGRSTIAEKLARALYSGETGTEGVEKPEEEKITLTGYREVKISRESLLGT